MTFVDELRRNVKHDWDYRWTKSNLNFYGHTRCNIYLFFRDEPMWQITLWLHSSVNDTAFCYCWTRATGMSSTDSSGWPVSASSLAWKASFSETQGQIMGGRKLGLAENDGGWGVPLAPVSPPPSPPPTICPWVSEDEKHVKNNSGVERRGTWQVMPDDIDWTCDALVNRRVRARHFYLMRTLLFLFRF